MALKVKAQEKLVKFSKTDAGVWRYVMMPELYTAPWTTLTEIKDPSDSILSPKQGSWRGLVSLHCLCFICSRIQPSDECSADVVPHAEDGTRDGGHRIGSEVECG